MRIKLLIALSILFLSAPTSVALASVVPTPAAICSPIFGGGPTCQQSDLITLNKKVLSPKVAANKGATFTDNDFVENVAQKDTRYTPNTPTAFRLYVTNKTNKELKDVVVSDVFPQNFLTFVTGNGTFDVKTHTFTTKITLKAQETRKITIQVLTATKDDIIKSNAPLCTVNVATAVVNKKTSQDNSMLCVALEQDASPISSFSNQTTPKANPAQTKGGLPVVSPIASNQMQKAPSTGPGMLALVGLVPVGLLGHYLRKKTA
ncbi:MAG: hypothetical protein KBC15_04045 [Candidatus Levybacteria bacterium]|nr:hypothetical protein [Candidatus Levybacteria bacterium]